jgi:hypothetical protein
MYTHHQEQRLEQKLEDKQEQEKIPDRADPKD